MCFRLLVFTTFFVKGGGGLHRIIQYKYLKYSHAFGLGDGGEREGIILWRTKTGVLARFQNIKSARDILKVLSNEKDA